MHYNGKLWASRLILGCTPIYMSYQNPEQALNVGNPLLSYIDVQHQGFFPLGLTIGEARDLGPQLIKVGSLVPMRDGSTDIVFHSCAEHILVEQPPVVWVVEQVEAELVDSSETEAKAKDSSDAMVVCCNMTADLFLSGR